MKTLRLLVLAGLALLVMAFIVAVSTPYWFATKREAAVDIRDPALIQQGAYLARAGDCAACHTAPAGGPSRAGCA